MTSVGDVRSWKITVHAHPDGLYLIKGANRKERFKIRSEWAQIARHCPRQAVRPHGEYWKTVWSLRLQRLEALPKVPRSRQRTTLESGLKLDLNELRRQGLIRPGTKCGVVIRRTNSTGEEIARGLITSNMEGEYEGWLRIRLGSIDQTIILVPKPRHFGGYQWYFVCPVMNQYASVLWMPPGATRFCSRQAWGRRVAYASQFLDPDNRAHRGQAKIKARLISDLDPDEWDLPPKPKGMRWRTYNRYVQKFDAYEDILNQNIAELMARLLDKS